MPLQLYCCNYLLVEMQMHVLSQWLTTNKRPCQSLALLENVYPAANRKPYAHYWHPLPPIVFPITELFINLLKSVPSTRFSECGVKKFLVALENDTKDNLLEIIPVKVNFLKKGGIAPCTPPSPSFVEEPASRALIMLFGWT